MSMIDKSSIISLRRKLEKEAWEIKSLGEIATEIVLGNRITQEQADNGNYPTICRPQILRNKENIHIRECANSANIESIKKPRYCQYGDLLLIQSCRRIENLGHAVVYLGNERPIIGDHVLKVTHNENPRLMPHLMACEFIRKQIRNFVEDTVIVDLRPKHLQQIKLPVLPIHIQDKVTVFLDQLSTLSWRLEEELNKELEKRKKQYEYYKEAVLSEVIKRWNRVSIDKVAHELVSGNKVTRAQLDTGNYPAIKCGDINSKLQHSFTECIGFVNPNLIKSKVVCEHGDVLVGALSSKVKNIGKASVYLGNEKPIVGEGVFLIKHQQNGKFLSYVLNSEFVREQMQETVNESTVINLGKSNLQKIKIPLPPLEEQNKIVEVLDKLRINTESLQDKIPLLIEDLKKQYIYYREQIFNPEIVN